MTACSTTCEVMKIKVKGFQLFTDRHGKPRCYHRASGTAIDLNAYPPGSVEFLGECGRIAALNVLSAPKPGSLGLLIKEYRKGAQWREAAPKTREWYEMAIEYLEPINNTPLMRFNPPLVVKIRDKALAKKGWYFANQVKTTLSTVFSWGAERGYIENNPAKQVKKLKRPKGLARANRPWTDQERFTVLSDLPAHFKPVIGAILYTGADTCDVIKLPNKLDAIEFSRQKTGVSVKQQLKSAFKAILKESPIHSATTLLANSYGRPWTKSGVDSIWHREKRRLEAEGKISPGLTLKGLRHTHATLLREMGEDDRSIADALGQKSEAMGRHYSRDADLSEKNAQQTKRFDRAEAQKIAKFVKPSGESVKP